MIDIQFVEVDAGAIEADLITQFEQALGVTLYPADERRIFLQQLAQVIVAEKNSINDSARQNLSRYSRDIVLDAWGERYGSRGKRLAGNKALIPIRVTLSAVQSLDVTVPKGTRITPEGTLFFATTADLKVIAGQSTIEGYAEALDIGERYNGFSVGAIKNIVDPVPYVSSITNTDVSADGSDVETDDNYRKRLWLLPESFSTAGPEGAYIFWAKSADSSIVDIAVDSPSAGVVRIIPLLKDGGIPGQIVLDKVLAAVSAKDRRPLTDNVQTDIPSVVNYDINLTYYLDEDIKADEMNYRKTIEGKNLDCASDSAIYQFISWQQSKLGRSVSPDQLRYFLQSATSYQLNGQNKTAVKRLALTAPVYTAITAIQVAKVGTITVTYGGLE